MTPTEHLIGFIAMALAIPAILVVGTLAAAEIIHIGPRRRATKARQSEVPKPAEYLTKGFTPLGSALAAGSQLRRHTETDPESTSHSKEPAMTRNPGGNSHGHG